MEEKIETTSRRNIDVGILCFFFFILFLFLFFSVGFLLGFWLQNSLYSNKQKMKTKCTSFN